MFSPLFFPTTFFGEFWFQHREEQIQAIGVFICQATDDYAYGMQAAEAYLPGFEKADDYVPGSQAGMGQ